MSDAAAVIAIDSTALITQLKSDLGAAFVLDAVAKRVFFSTDIASEGEVAQCVVQPGNAEELSLAVTRCTQAGAAVVPRGGGFSYTGGYTPVSSDTVVIDMRRMDKIVEVNTEDMYVTVECGCTWKKLYDALKAKGYRNGRRCIVARQLLFGIDRTWYRGRIGFERRCGTCRRQHGENGFRRRRRGFPFLPMVRSRPDWSIPIR